MEIPNRNKDKLHEYRLYAMQPLELKAISCKTPCNLLCHFKFHACLNLNRKHIQSVASEFTCVAW